VGERVRKLRAEACLVAVADGDLGGGAQDVAVEDVGVASRSKTGRLNASVLPDAVGVDTMTLPPPRTAWIASTWWR
jgi:hypothetical protein